MVLKFNFRIRIKICKSQKTAEESAVFFEFSIFMTKMSHSL